MGGLFFADTNIYLLSPYQINSYFGNEPTKLAKHITSTHYFQYIIYMFTYISETKVKNMGHPVHLILSIMS